MAVLSGTGAVAPESLSKQVCGCPVGTVADMIQMREATICLMVDMEGGREGRWGEYRWRHVAPRISIGFEEDHKSRRRTLSVPVSRHRGGGCLKLMCRNCPTKTQNTNVCRAFCLQAVITIDVVCVSGMLKLRFTLVKVFPFLFCGLKIRSPGLFQRLWFFCCNPPK